MKIPSIIWKLSIATMLLNISFLMVYSVSTIYFYEVLGLTAASIGIISGISESLSYFIKFISGALSDKYSNRITFVKFGILGVFISRIGFAIFQTPVGATISRVVERISNGIQAAPCDAWIGDKVERKDIGAAYGLRRGLSMLGAFLGVIMAIYFLKLSTFQYLFLAASIPAIIAFFIINSEKKSEEININHKNKKEIGNVLNTIKNIQKKAWLVIITGGLLSLVRTMEIFFPIYALKEISMEKEYVPIIYLISYGFYSIFAYPAGKLCDKKPPYIVYILSTFLICIFLIIFSYTSNCITFFIAISIWGIYLAVNQTLFSYLIAKITSNNERGTAFGIYHTISAVTMLIGGATLGNIVDSGDYLKICIILLSFIFFVGLFVILQFKKIKI